MASCGFERAPGDGVKIKFGGEGSRLILILVVVVVVVIMVLN